MGTRVPYLVDGNNVMALISGWHRDMASARRRLIHALAAFIAAHRAKVKVVFDGPADAEFPDGRRFRSVHILYAKPGSNADARIQEILARSSSKRDMVLVSSDRALISYAKNKGSKVISAAAFKGMLDEAVEQKIVADKSLRSGDVDVEEWLEYFGTHEGKERTE